MGINLFEHGLESLFLSKDEPVMAVCPVKYFEVGVIHPRGEALVLIVSVLGECLEVGVKFWDYVGKVKLINEVKRWDVFFVVF